MVRLIGTGRCVILVMLISAVSIAQAPPPEKTTLSAVVAQTKDSLDNFWRAQIANYRAPREVRAYVPGPDTPCRVKETGNAYYCPETEGIYYDQTLLESYLTEIGNYGPQYILAHEWGHRVQDVLGLFSGSTGLWPIQKELQADCYAGAYLRHATPKADTPAAMKQMVLSVFSVGDRHTPWFDPEAHGRPGQRIDAFNEGLGGRACGADTFFLAIGLDLSSSVQPPTPTRGSLAERLPADVGRFRRESAKRTPALIRLGATEVIEAVYRASNGVSATVTLAAFATPAQSGELFSTYVGHSGQLGFKVIRKTSVVSVTREELGSILLLQGATEVVVWTNRQVFGLVEGPIDYAWELATTLLHDS